MADPGKMEVELQPAGGLHDESGTTLIAPGTRLNFGVIEGWEAVLEGVRQMPLSPDAGPSSLSAAGAFLKGIIRPGVLQDKTGPSIATEFGVLLPDSIGETTFGASAAWIVTQFETISGLVGLIWQMNEDVAFDLAVRHAITNGRPVDELRAGLTFGFPLWRPGGAWH